MSRTSSGQMKKLLEIMSQEGTLKSGRVVYTATLNRQAFWRRIGMQLNAFEGGVYKNTWKWCKMWADWKNKTKTKVNTILRKSYSPDEPKPTLTSLEYQLLKVIDFPMDQIASLKREPLHKMEDEEEVERDVFADAKDSEAEDVTAIQFLVSSNIDRELDSAENLLRKGRRNIGRVEYLDEGSGNEHLYSSKSKGKKYRKKRRLEEQSPGPVDSSVLEQYKLKTSLALERERLRQRNEELRLKALELKLKGDELRIKEAEMNKISLLTNVEEEKLKCFRDVAALLKELVERTKNGNPNTQRFHNII